MGFCLSFRDRRDTSMADTVSTKDSARTAQHAALRSRAISPHSRAAGTDSSVCSEVRAGRCHRVRLSRTPGRHTHRAHSLCSSIGKNRTCRFSSSRTCAQRCTGTRRRPLLQGRTTSRHGCSQQWRTTGRSRPAGRCHRRAIGRRLLSRRRARQQRLPLRSSATASAIHCSLPRRHGSGQVRRVPADRLARTARASVAK